MHFSFFLKLNCQSSDFQQKIVSRTSFKMENWIFDTNFIHKKEQNSLPLTRLFNLLIIKHLTVLDSARTDIFYRLIHDIPIA